MAYIVIRLGQHGFPCGASAHETEEDARRAAKAHAHEQGLSVRRNPLTGGKLTQWLTGPESMNSYVIVQEGEDDEEHGFGDFRKSK